MTAVSTHGRGPAEGELSSGKCTSLDYCALDRQDDSSEKYSHLALDLCLGMARIGSLLSCLRALSNCQRCSRAAVGETPHGRPERESTAIIRGPDSPGSYRTKSTLR